MGILGKFQRLVLGEAGERNLIEEEDNVYPQPIEFISLLKVKMREDIQNITPQKAIVPSHYTVLLHAEAHDRLAPAFNEICTAAAEELSAEVERIRKIPYGDPIDQAVDLVKRKVKNEAASSVQREVHPMDYVWSIELVPVLYDHDGSAAPKNYLAVATSLLHRSGSEVVSDGEDDVPLKVTVKNPFSNVYESHFVHGVGKNDAGGRNVTITAPFRGDGQAVRLARPTGQAGSILPGALGVLSFQYPGEQKTHRFPITQKEIIIGRETDKNDNVHLRLKVEVQVSAEHLRLRLNEDQGRFEVMDLSTYGTRVDEEKVPRSDPVNGIEHWWPVEDGAKLNLGGYMFLTFCTS